MPAERLQKLMARAGVGSRRAAERLIAEGRVAVNGHVATLGDSADPMVDRVEIDGRALSASEPSRHYALHKPRGFVSSARDERGRRSVVSLLGAEATRGGARLWPAGRLDVESEGLMLLTNDGAWANRVLHPRYGTVREYAILVEPAPNRETLRQLQEGVALEDGPVRLLAARVTAPPPEVEREPREVGAWLRVRIGEGRKREVRRLFEAAGHRVLRLIRTRIGSVALNGLHAGEWRALTAGEVGALADRRRASSNPSGRGHGPLTVAIDGPSGAGKSTIGHALAQRIGATFVDTGLMYRALTLAALKRDVDVDDGEGLGRLASDVRIGVQRPSPRQTDRLETVLLDGRDVTRAVRTPRVDRAVSAVSRHPQVRTAMLGVQRAAAHGGPTVMVGRDIGTVVLPEAEVKVYLTASAQVRATRRAAEMGRPDRVAEYLAEIEQRDALDAGRELAPLRVPPGALVLDTGELGVDECVDRIAALIPAADT